MPIHDQRPAQREQIAGDGFSHVDHTLVALPDFPRGTRTMSQDKQHQYGDDQNSFFVHSLLLTVAHCTRGGGLLPIYRLSVTMIVMTVAPCAGFRRDAPKTRSNPSI